MAKTSSKIKLTCIQCNSEYELPPSKAKNSKFCSRQCKDEHKRKEVKIAKCLCCGTEFEAKRGKKYCSRKCYLTENKIERVQLK